MSHASGTRLSAIVLAAGSGHRFGATKQLADFGGDTLVARAVRTAEAACSARTVLVTGNDWQKVAESAAPLSGFLVYNEEHASGIGGSIAAGVGAVREASDAVLLMLCDTPLVGPAELAELVAAYRKSPDSIVCSSFGDTLGPPCVFPAEFFGELTSLEGDTGARSILSRDPDRVITVPCEAAGIDIDSTSDLQRLTGKSD